MTPARYPELADREWLRELYLVGEHAPEAIADHLGCHPVTVCRWLAKHGIPTRPGDDFQTRQTGLREWFSGPPSASQESYMQVLANLLGIEEPLPRTRVQASDVIDKLQALVEADPTLVACETDGCEYIVDTKRGQARCSACRRENEQRPGLGRDPGVAKPLQLPPTKEVREA